MDNAWHEMIHRHAAGALVLLIVLIVALTSLSRHSLSALDPALREITNTLEDLGFGDQAADANVLHEVLNQGYLLSSLDIFYFSDWTTLVFIAACWLNRRPAAKAVAGGGE